LHRVRAETTVSVAVLEVRLTGALALRADGAELAPPASRRARSVLAYLALHPGRHGRAQLAAHFWPDVLDESARTSLRAALSELRRALGPAADQLLAGRDSVALEAAVDTRAFAAALEAGDAAAALAASRGPILDGFDDDWAHDARRAHAERLAEALERLAAEAEPSEAIRLTREQVALDPLAEEPNRRLVERLAAAGDRAAALAAGDRFAERLRGSLGIPPSRETRALLDELRRAPVVPVAPPRALARAHATEFVGRRAELARLRASWGGVQMHRDRRLVLLAGEPGVGKTRLAHEFAAGVLADRATVLLGRCSEEPLAPFEPFAEALRQAGAAEALDPGAADAAGARHRLFDAVDAVLCDHVPLLLVIDDLHWADRGTLLLASFVLRSSRPGPLVIVGTYRDTELGRRSPLTSALAELQRDGALDRIAVRGLGEDDVAALARSLLGADDVAGAVHARTGGNAFFVEEVLHGLTEAGTPDVPESVRHAVGVRLARLGDAANELLAVAAILGLEQDAAALQATARLEPDVEELALDEVLRARLLRPAAAPRHFEFAHALVREAVLHELNVLRRQRLHRRAADALAELGEDRHLEEIAAHLFEAADARRAAEMLDRAGRRALDSLAYEHAAEQFARALDALALADAQHEAGPVLLARGDALLRAGEPGAARTAFTSAAELARRRGDAGMLGEAALGFAGLGIAIVDLDTETIARLEEALEAAADPVLRSRLQARLAVELYYAPDRTRSEALSAEAVATARATGNGNALASALSARHVALWRPDRTEERLATAAEMIATARVTGQRHDELQARNWRVADLFELGDMTAFRQEVTRHARLADELRLPSFQWYTPLWAAVEAVLAGRFEQADVLAERAREQGLRAGDRNAELFADMLVFTGQLERGEFDQIDVAFIEHKIATSPAGPAYAASHAWVLAALGETEAARATLDDAVAQPHAFDANWMSAQAECAEACLLLGDSTHAAVLYERLLPYAGRPATAGRAVASYGAVDRALGDLAALLGHHDDAVAHLRDAILRNDELGCTVWRLHSQWSLQQIAPQDPLTASAATTAQALGLHPTRGAAAGR
jgi:DNA-binding SARP family transcriptional activator